MEELYRFKIQTDQFAVELESTNKDFVEQHMLNLLKVSETSTLTTPSPSVPAISNDVGVVDDVPIPDRAIEMDTEQADSVVQFILNSDKLTFVRSRVLEKANQLNKILMVFYFTNELYGNQFLTTSFIEHVLARFGRRIAKSNLGTKIKNNEEYFAADSEPKRGTPTQYRIRQIGIERFNNIIKD